MLKHALKAVWARWNVIAHKIGNFQARAFLSLFYFVVLAPFALGVKIFCDPLRLRPDSALGWLKRVTAEGDPMTEAERQF